MTPAEYAADAAMLLSLPALLARGPLPAAYDVDYGAGATAASAELDAYERAFEYEYQTAYDPVIDRMMQSRDC